MINTARGAVMRRPTIFLSPILTKLRDHVGIASIKMHFSFHVIILTNCWLISFVFIFIGLNLPICVVPLKTSRTALWNMPFKLTLCHTHNITPTIAVKSRHKSNNFYMTTSKGADQWLLQKKISLIHFIHICGMS